MDDGSTMRYEGLFSVRFVRGSNILLYIGTHNTMLKT
jgi:hypothetical protein